MGLIYTPKSGRKPDMQVDFATGLLTQDPATSNSYPSGFGGDMTYAFGIPFVWIGEQHLAPVTGSNTTSANYIFSTGSTGKALTPFPLRILGLVSYFKSGMDPTDFDGTNGSLTLRLKTPGALFGPVSITEAVNISLAYVWPNTSTGSLTAANVAGAVEVEVELIGRLEDGSGSTPTLKLITQVTMMRLSNFS